MADTNEVKVSQLAALSSVPDNAQIMIVVDGVSYRVSKKNLLKSIQGNALLVSAGFTVAGDTVTFNSAYQWMILGDVYGNSEVVKEEIPAADTGMSRIDIFVGNAAGDIVRVPGDESEDNPFAPAVPDNTVLITFVTVNDSEIVSADPVEVSEYITKAEKRIGYPATSADGLLENLPVVDRCNFVFTDGFNFCSEIRGLTFDSDFKRYPGQIIMITNDQEETDLVLKNNHPDSDVPMYLRGLTDFVIKPTETAMLMLVGKLNVAKQVVWGASGEVEVPGLAEVLAAGNSAASDVDFHEFMKLINSASDHAFEIKLSDEGTVILGLGDPDGYNVEIDSNGVIRGNVNVISQRFTILSGAGSNSVFLTTDALTESRDLKAPDASGTIALESYVDTKIAAATINLWDDRGSYNPSSGAYPTSGGSGTAGAILKGDTWTISAAGTLPTGQVVENGDVIRALTDTPGNTQANWAIMQNNIGYVAENSANKGTSMAGNSTSNVVYLTAKAVYDWAVGLFAPLDSPVFTGNPTVPVGIVSADNASSSRYFRTNGTIALFGTDVRGTALAGLPTASTAPVTASSTVLDAIGQLNAAMPRQLKDFYTNVSNTGTSETDLYSYTLPANTLSAVGQKLVFETSGVTGSGSFHFGTKVKLGSSTVYEVGAFGYIPGGNNANWNVRTTIIRTGANTARAFTEFLSSVNDDNPTSTRLNAKQTDLTGLNFATTNVLKITGTSDVATGDITAKFGSIIWYPAAP